MIAVRAAGGAAGRAAAAGPVRPDARPGPRPRCCAQTLLSGTDDDVHRARSPPSCRRSAAGSPPGVDPDRLMISGDRPGHRAGPDAGASSPRCSPARPTRTTRSPPSGTGWSTGSRWRRASPRTWPGWRCSSGSTATTRTRCRPREPDAGRARSARRRCAALHAERVHPAGAMLVLVGDVAAGAGARRGRAGARRLERRRARPPSCRRVPPLRARAAAAGRPARLGAVVAADRRCRRSGAPTPTTPRCSWPTWSSAATSPPAGWRTSARTRATPTARTRWSSTRWPGRRWSSPPRWPPR